MPKIIPYLAAVLAFCLCFPCVAWDGNDNIMYWMVDESALVDDGPNTVYSFLGIEHENDEIGARIACYDNDGTFIRYLNPVYPNSPDVPGGVDWEYNDQIIGTRDDIAQFGKGQAYYGSEAYSERLFQIQVGNYDEDGNFATLLYSRKETVDAIHWYDQGSILPPGTEWTPTDFYTVNPSPSVPEPSSGILLTIGISLLMLRRKHGLG